MGWVKRPSWEIKRGSCRQNVYIRLDRVIEFRHNVYVRVISLKPLRDFWQRHADAEEPLRRWHRVATEARWTNLMDVRQTFPSADGVTDGGETLTVFNIGGNKYRLVARIRYDYQLVNVRCVLTHEEYDAGKWKA